jgi:hypothetical protein
MDGGLVPAFSLMLYLADASHNDCETTVKMCGFGDSEAPFGVLDIRLLDLIEKRYTQSSATRQEELSDRAEAMDKTRCRGWRVQDWKAE